MLYALNEERRRVRPVRTGQRAICPSCDSEVISKCGDINIWHWAHKSRDCDNWSEGESLWHRNWKRIFPPESREVLIEKNGVKHRADIYYKKLVIELQKSSIAPSVIRQREHFYGKKMVWIFDGTHLTKMTLDILRSILYEWFMGPDGWTHRTLYLRRGKKGTINFRWKGPRKYMGMTNRLAFIDLGKIGIFELRKLYIEGGPPYGGWGYLYHNGDFRRFIKDPYSFQYRHLMSMDFDSLLTHIRKLDEARDDRYISG